MTRISHLLPPAPTNRIAWFYASIEREPPIEVQAYTDDGDTWLVRYQPECWLEAMHAVERWANSRLYAFSQREGNVILEGIYAIRELMERRKGDQ